MIDKADDVECCAGRIILFQTFIGVKELVRNGAIVQLARGYFGE
jgi:hypothetical protein